MEKELLDYVKKGMIFRFSTYMTMSGKMVRVDMRFDKQLGHCQIPEEMFEKSGFEEIRAWADEIIFSARDTTKI